MDRFAAMQTVWPPERDSIFGDTYQGVPNPNVPHQHPWPTRYHGPNWTVPGTANITYRQRPYVTPPFVGMGAAPFVEAIGSNITGSPWVDAVLGAAVGWVASPDDEARPMWMVVAAIAGYGFGLAGFVGVGAMLYAAHKGKSGR